MSLEERGSSGTRQLPISDVAPIVPPRIIALIPDPLTALATGPVAVSDSHHLDMLGVLLLHRSLDEKFPGKGALATVPKATSA